jgi:4-hydroxyphenylpyruvate dioxygenase-like putative hemolysin
MHCIDDTINTRFSIHEHLKHGDGVKVAALWVEDAKTAYEETMKRGAFFMEPTVEKRRTRRGSSEFILTVKQYTFL